MFRTALLFSKKDELKLFEERLRARLAGLDEKEKSLALRDVDVRRRETACSSREQQAYERELLCEERESAVSARELENETTLKKLHLASETLKTRWEEMKGEQGKMRDSLPMPSGIGKCCRLDHNSKL
jgi:hypothetical protein